jgi:hypothetical protein
MKMSKCINDIETRSLAAGGFAEQPGGPYRPDSTAWAILALEKAGAGNSIIAAGRNALAAGGFQDGRVFLPGAPDVIWPTPLAILAWHGNAKYLEALNRATDFLMETSGNHWKREPEFPENHDSSLRGWPWVLGTHSFIEPTAIALLALERMRHDDHPRFREGIQMIMNRRLPRGGWNYGNTLVFGAELFPFIDATGMALTALAGHTSEESVKSGIDYLRAEAENCRAPLSLGWALFGLGAWGIFPGESEIWIEETLARQEKLGAYGTSLLSLLALAFFCRGNFRDTWEA